MPCLLEHYASIYWSLYYLQNKETPTNTFATHKDEEMKVNILINNKSIKSLGLFFIGTSKIFVILIYLPFIDAFWIIWGLVISSYILDKVLSVVSVLIIHSIRFSNSLWWVSQSVSLVLDIFKRHGLVPVH